MIGAIIGDIIGSRFERKNLKSKDFELFTDECHPTDDSIMTISVMDAICRSDRITTIGEYAVQSMQSLGRSYPNCGFGGNFYNWIFSKHPAPYESWGNGAAMRISPVGFSAKDLAAVHAMSHEIASVSHNHIESYKAAEAVASAIWLARNGMTKDELHNYICKFYYPLDKTLDEIRQTYRFDSSCQGSVPQAFQAFFESSDFEDAIRSAVSIGGDSDTIAAVCGGIADAYYGVPKEIDDKARGYLDKRLRRIIENFEERCT